MCKKLSKFQFFFQFAGAVVISENLMRDVADKAIDLGLELEPHDVKIISDIVNMMGPEKSSSDMEIAAIMTRCVKNSLWSHKCSRMQASKMT